MASPSAGNEKTLTGVSIGQYLIRRLCDYGVRDVFGIPGDYVLAFYAMMEKGPLRLIGCTREDCAGFAADAYARVNGIGAVCVTYCVGGLSLCNSIAGAYAEKSPVVVISGAPGLGERVNNPLLHHKVKDFQTQADVFRRLCGIEAQLNDPNSAFRRIDRVLGTRIALQAAGLYRAAPRPGRRCAGGALHHVGPPDRRAIRTCWPRPWPRPRGGSPPPAAR